MKKRTLILLTIASLLTCSLTACGERNIDSNPVDKAGLEMSNFKTIDSKDYLVYDIDTRVVYYMFSTAEWSADRGYGYSYFAPYVSKNGRFCRFVNDEIVEIVETVETNN